MDCRSVPKGLQWNNPTACRYDYLPHAGYGQGIGCVLSKRLRRILQIVAPSVAHAISASRYAMMMKRYGETSHRPAPRRLMQHRIAAGGWMGA
jgi:hypothetical protein